MHSLLNRGVFLPAAWLLLIATVSARAAAPETMYLRFKPLSADGVYARVRMTLHQSPWSLERPNLPRAGAGYRRVRIARGNYSPWAELPALWGAITLTFCADAPLANVEAEVQLATAEDEKAVFKTLRLREPDTLVSLVLPADFLAHPAGIVTVRQNAAAHLQTARATIGKAGPPRSQFPFFTGGAGGFGSLYTDPEIARTELRALRTLGINGLGYPGSKTYMGLVESVGFDHFLLAGDNPTPAQAQAQQALSPAAFAKIRYNAVHDEPGNYGAGVLDTLPVEQFHAFLQARGLTPADFGQPEWKTITPIRNITEARQVFEDWGAKRGKSAYMRYYWTARYAQELTMDWIRAGTAKSEAVYGPRVRTFVNFTDHPLILGNGMLPGPDWFRTGYTRATTIGWTEDWFYGNSNSWGNGIIQRVGFLLNVLRNGGSPHRSPVGMYNTWDGEDSLRLKALCGIGHGGKAIYFWDYGPTYAATENYWADSPATYAGVAQVAREVAGVDDLILPGQPPAAPVAIVYSTTAEIWETNWNLSQERQLLLAALEQQQYAVDVINEDLLLDRDLRQYRVIYLADKQLPAACQRALARWVNDGGTLVLLPEAGTRDEYDRPSDLLAPWTPAGDRTADGRAEVVSFAGKDAALRGLPMRLIFRAGSWAARSGHADAGAIAAFADGRPAIQLATAGKGRYLLYAFMPGNSFFKLIMEANPPPNPVHLFPAGARRLITWPCELAKAPRRVTLSYPAVGAYLLESPRGAALVLVNYTRARIDKLAVQVQLPGIRRVISQRQGKRAAKYVSGKLTFTLPVGITDTVALRK